MIFPAGLLWPGTAFAVDAEPPEKEKIEIEHIFGFTEGTDIGDKGETEFESTTVARFGRPGSYAAIGNESSFRDVVIDGLRLSFGGLTDYYNVHDMPGLADRSGFDFTGFSTEIRWQPLDRTTTPIGLALSITPQWQRVDELSGANAQGFAIPVALAVDAALIPNKLFTAFNLIYEPDYTRAGAGWDYDSSLEVSAAASYAISKEVFVGAELRYLDWHQQGLFTAHGLFAGPSVYWQLSEKVALKVALSTEIADEGSQGPGLANFERNQVIVLFVKSF